MKKTKGRIKQYVEKNPIEELLSIGTGAVSSVADTGRKIADIDKWDEVLGFTDPKEKQKQQVAGELTEGQILDLRKIHKQDQEEAAKAEKNSDIEPGIDYRREIVHAGERLASQENREMEAQLREIMAEIKKLADSSNELRIQFKEVAVEQRAEKPGKYHKNFFEWLLSVVRIARMKVEDSGAWLAAMHSKKKSRQYGAMAKKHGTTFTLNNERTVATQVG